MTKLKTKLQTFFRSDKAKKAAAVLALICLFCSLFCISSSAADDQIVYQTIAPIYFSNFGGDVTAVAFPGYSTESLYSQTSGVVNGTPKTFLNNSDYYNEYNNRLKTKTLNGVEVTYIEVNILCNYSSIYVNSVLYPGSESSPTRINLLNTYQLECYPVANSYDAGTTYRFYFDIILSNSDALEQARQEGYDQGYAEGYQSGYTSGTSSSAIESARQQGYNEGYSAGRLSTDSENLGQNLLGDTLSAPMDALNSFTLYKSSSGFEVTLGLVVGGAISLTLFIAFLKIFAGG